MKELKNQDANQVQNNCHWTECDEMHILTCMCYSQTSLSLTQDSEALVKELLDSQDFLHQSYQLLPLGLSPIQ